MRKEAIILTAIFTASLLILGGCQNMPSDKAVPPKDFCREDADCICQGIDLETNDCFLGNREYHQTDKVDKERDCADFCTGFANNLQIKCLANKCQQIVKEEFREKTKRCAEDADCVPSECCHATECVHKDFAPDCSGIMCTMNCEPGTMDCGGRCVCEAGRCTAQIPEQ
ncbi:hypothetical protein JW968_05595 [Candidatus Woesearchaeota archaeon]|nr:hypothetical protein [Candidatus Woesearchaeota archaeon]